MTSSREENTWIDVVGDVSISVRRVEPLDPDTLWPLVDLAVDTPRVLEALREFREPAAWDALYRVFEIVRDDVGGEIQRAGWATKAEQERFKQTANSLDRHAKGVVPPPKKPMTLPEGADFVRKVLRRWIEAKLHSSRAEGDGPKSGPPSAL